MQKKVYLYTLASLLLLLSIFMGNTLLRYMGNLIEGFFSFSIIMELMVFELIRYAILLTPFSYFLSLIFVIGEMQENNEITALLTTGYSRKKLLSYIFYISSVLSIILLFLVFIVMPNLLLEREYIKEKNTSSTLMKYLIPGKFYLYKSNNVIYVDSLSLDKDIANNIVVIGYEKNDSEDFFIITAKKAKIDIISKNESYIHLQDGHRYSSDNNKMRISKYSDLSLKKIETIPLNIEESSITCMKLLDLWNHNDQKCAIHELQRRLSTPISVLVLGIIAFAIYGTMPRQSKYKKLVLGIIVYLLYSAMLFISRNLTLDGTLPFWLGSWWVHGFWLVFGFFIYNINGTNK